MQIYGDVSKERAEIEKLRKTAAALLAALDAADNVKRGDFYHERKALREALSK